MLKNKIFQMETLIVHSDAKYKGVERNIGQNANQL